MRTLRTLVLVLLASIGLTAPLSAAAREALCIVCQVREGATHLEPVKATRMHEGREYTFCSEGCAKAFTLDPAAFIAPPAGPAALPDFQLTTLEGKPVDRASLAGGLVLLDFWATWCLPCRKSMPDLQTLHEKHGGKGLEVIGVSIDEKGAGTVKKFLKGKPFTYRMLLDSADQPLWETLGIQSIPAAFLVDGEGRILERWLGKAPTMEQLERAVGARLASDASPRTP